MRAGKHLLTALLILAFLQATASAQESNSVEGQAPTSVEPPADAKTYIVQPGESLFAIARQFNIAVEALKRANDWSENVQLFAGQAILIPTDEDNYLRLYEVQPGDTLYSISKRFGSTASVLQGLNEIADGRHIEAGQRILVPRIDESALVAYEVRAGDTLFSIANEFDSALSLLMSLNGIADEAALTAGQSLLIPKVDAEDYQTHVIADGETLYSIAKRYATTAEDLIALNGLGGASAIEVGQRILVPAVDETKYAVHVVEAGESLFHISRLYLTTTAHLGALNGIEVGTDLIAGHRILVPKLDETIFERYIVQTGDSLHSISKRANVSIVALQVLNKLADARSLRIGQAILLPILEKETLDVYVVETGDTLAKIAEAHNTSVDYLRSLNGIADPSLILPEQAIVVPKPAPTAVRAGFGFGIQVYQEADRAGDLAALVSKLGVNWVKIDVPWADIEREEGVFQFESLDAMVAAMDRANVNIMLNIYAAPDWSRARHIEKLNSQMRDYSGPPEDLKRLGSFLANLVTRYAGLVDAYEIWKSPNLLRFWLSPVYHRAPEKTADGEYGIPDEIQLGAEYYVSLLKVAYDTIKAHDPQALVISGGLAPVGFSDHYNSIETGAFLSEMLRRGAAEFSDGIGAIFSASAVPPLMRCCVKPPGVDSHYESFMQYILDLLDFYQEILRSNGHSDMPIFLTQFGWGTREGTNLAIPSSGYEWLNYTSQAEQALYVTQAYRAAQSQNHPAAMILHNLNGCSAGDEEACFFSLVDAAEELRPAFSSFAAVPKTLDAA